MAGVGGGDQDNPARVPVPDQGPPGDPLGVFPNEVWSMLFENMKEDPRDILNLSETCTLFNAIVERDNDLPGRRLEEVIPLLLQHMEREDILNCRGITKRIRKAVDKVLSNVGFISSRENVNVFPRLIPQQTAPARIQSYEWRQFSGIPEIDIGQIDSVERLGQLVRDFEQGVITSLVTNSLSLVVSQMDGERASWIPGDILERIVSSLYSLRDLIEQLVLADQHHEFGATIDDPIPIFDIIRRCVPALPKLRRLECEGFPKLSENVQVGAPTLERYIAAGHPLPEVPLEMLKIYEFTLPVSFFREIVRRWSGHLKELDIFLCLSEIVSGDDLRGWEEEYHFPALRELKLDDFTWRWQPILAKIRADKLECFRWTVLDPPERPEYPENLIVQVIQRFPSISRLWLHVNLDRLVDIMDLWEAALEGLHVEPNTNLKQLYLKDYWYNIPLQFFAKLFPNLESIKIYCVSWGTFFHPRVHDPDLVLCFERQFQKSTLWTLLPKLETFEICPFAMPERYLFTRANVEACRNRQD